MKTKKLFTDQYQFNTRGNSGQSGLKLRAKGEFMHAASGFKGVGCCCLRIYLTFWICYFSKICFSSTSISVLNRFVCGIIAQSSEPY